MTGPVVSDKIAATDMTREVRYTSTSDGVLIGYAVSGSGPPLVAMPDIGFSSTLQDEQNLPEAAAWAEALSRRFTYIRYDARGYGFSERSVPDMSISAWQRDLEAVIRSMELRRYVLIGWLASSRVALAYAADHADEVTHLVVLPPDYPVLTSSEGESLEALARHDWETFTETLAHVAMGWERGDRARALSAHWRRMTSQETYLQFLDQFRWPDLDQVEALRHRLVAPLLVIARRHKYLTNRIPVISAKLDARIVILPGDAAMPYEGDTAPIIDTMARFIEGRAPDVEEAPAELADVDPLGGRHLTQRERQVLDLLAKGKSNLEIADELVISVRTVERHLMRIYGKFGVSGKSARVVAAAHAILQVT